MSNGRDLIFLFSSLKKLRAPINTNRIPVTGAVNGHQQSKSFRITACLQKVQAPSSGEQDGSTPENPRRSSKLKLETENAS
jgi:hypothetical protein